MGGGEHRLQRNTVAAPRPAVRATPRRAYPAVYVGAVSEQAIDRAVRIADGLLVYCATPGDFAERYGLLQQVLTDRGKDQSDFPFVATGIVHVDEDADRAWEQAVPAIAYLEGAIAGYAAGATSHQPAHPDLRASAGRISSSALPTRWPSA